MTSIKEAIQHIPLSRTAFITNEHEYSYSDICKLKSNNLKIIQSLRGKNIAINGRERCEFALLLSLLDGEVSKILFLPSDIDSSLHNQYYKQAEIDCEVRLENSILYVKNISNKNHETKSCSETEWIIPTSGTTNIPKLVSHSFISLTRSTKFDIEKAYNFRWGLVFDIYRFSGIQVFLQSFLAGSTLIITNPSQSISETIRLLAEKGCNALSATPSFWRKVLMVKESNALKLKRITLGGEIADQNILYALKQKFPKAKITHIYASTEIGVGFSVNDGKEGFPISFLTGELKNIKMKVDQDGLLWIAPSKKGQKYLSSDQMFDKDGYINTGDRVQIKGDRVYFLGRNSGAINVGGNKVQPEEVERVLLSSGLVSEAYVYGMKNPIMGSLVCAEVVLSDISMDKQIAKRQLLKLCQENLENFKVPAIFKFVKELKTTHSGKLERKQN